MFWQLSSQTRPLKNSAAIFPVVYLDAPFFKKKKKAVIGQIDRKGHDQGKKKVNKIWHVTSEVCFIAVSSMRVPSNKHKL